MGKRWTILDQISLFMWLWNTVLAVGLVFFMLRYKLDLGTYFTQPAGALDLDRWRAFVLAKWSPMILSALFLMLFVAMSMENKKASGFGPNLFSRLQMPQQWRLVPGNWVYWAFVINNLAIFLALLWFLDNIAVFAALLALFYAQAVVWTVQTRSVARQYFEKYGLPSKDPHARFIQRRRDAVEQYLFRRSLVTREILNSGGCLTVVLLELLPQSPVFNQMHWASHVVLATVTLVSEYVIWIWRRVRNATINQADDEQSDLDAVGAGET